MRNFDIPPNLSFQINSNLKKLLFSSIAIIIESKETKVAKTFNNFFSNIVENLEIPKCKCEDDLYNQLSRNPVLQTIMKYRNHPSINTICRFSQRNSSFYFSPVDKYCT